ncbi:F-box/kelch-repeat protein At3g06240-like [Silene latifolia]|uniref:F-box/kelch-repeat protein At3g06240-like n=1 Tax=Silene latifolia TaxID=37657 RepID=UPI003D76C0D7
MEDKKSKSKVSKTKFHKNAKVMDYNNHHGHGHPLEMKQPLVPKTKFEKINVNNNDYYTNTTTVRVKVLMTKDEAAKLLAKRKKEGTLEFKDVVNELVNIPAQRVISVAPLMANSKDIGPDKADPHTQKLNHPTRSDFNVITAENDVAGNGKLSKGGGGGVSYFVESMETNLSIFLKDDSLNVKEILPEDILVEILLRLPNDIIGSYAICKADGDIPFICWGPQFDIFNHDLHVCILSKHFGDVPLDLKPDLLRDTAPSFPNAPHLIHEGLLVGCVKGLVCFIWGLQDLGLWNPATREFKAITPWLYNPIHVYRLNLIGFGFDSLSNDFKIVRGNCSDDGIHSYEVYSLATNSWKSLREPSTLVKLFRTFTEAYLNGVCYWPAYSDLFDTPLILSFNFSTEVFMVFNEPQNSIGSEIKFEPWEITVYKECLADVVTRTDLEKAECNFDIWVVTEFDDVSGVPKSWQHLFTMGPFPSSDGLKFDRFRMDGDVLFVIRCPGTEEESSLYNLSNGVFKDFGCRLDGFFDYVGSLFPLSKRLAQSSKL